MRKLCEYKSWLRLVSLVAVCVAANLAMAQEQRTWSDNTGKFSVDAVLLSEDAEAVELRTTAGKNMRVPKSRLSKADLAYLSEINKTAGSSGQAATASKSLEPERIVNKLTGQPVRLEDSSENTLASYLLNLGVPVYLEKRSLSAAGIDANTPVTIPANTRTLAEQLDQVCSTLHLDWQPLGSLILVSTQDELDERGSFAMYRVPVVRGDYSTVMQQIQNIAPRTWLSSGGEGAVLPLPPSPIFLIRQSPAVHRMLAAQMNVVPVTAPYVHALDKVPVSINAKATKLSEVAASLSQQIAKPVVIDKEALGVIGLGDVPLTVQLENVSAKEFLDCVLHELDCTWLERESELLITTIDDAEKDMEDKRYSSNLGKSRSNATLQNLLMQMVYPDSWEVTGGRGQLTSSGNALKVTQSQPVLRELDRLAALLKQVR